MAKQEKGQRARIALARFKDFLDGFLYVPLRLGGIVFDAIGDYVRDKLYGAVADDYD